MFDSVKQIFEKISDLNMAVENYREESVIQSLPSVAYVNRAKKLMEKGQYKDALKVLEEAESLPQQDALVFKYKGIIYDKLFRFEDAVKAYKKSANLNCNDKVIWRNLGFALLNNGLYDESVESFENADKLTHGNSEVLMGWGMALMKQSKYSEAHEKFVQSAKANRYNQNAIFLAAVTEIRLEMYSEAENKLQFLANVAPNEANSYEYARLKFLNDDYDNAIFYSNKALEFNKNMLPAYVLAGRAYRQKNDEVNSLNKYKEAEDLSLINGNLYIEWSLSLMKFERYAEALLKVERAESFDGETKESKFIKSYCALFCEGGEVNTDILKEAMDDKDLNNFALFARGIISCNAGDYSDGIHYFKLGLKADCTDVRNYYYIADAYKKMGSFSNAKEYYEMSIKENPTHKKSYIEYSETLMLRENYSEINRKLRKALKYIPDDMEILNLLFYANYMLAKANICEYNIKDTLEIAQRIQELNSEAFRYSGEAMELAEILKDLQKKETN